MTYAQPDDLSEALALLDGGARTILAGGTDLYPATQSQRLNGDILDISRLGDLSGVSQDTGFYRIGAATSWAEIARAELPAGFAALQAAAREVGAVQIQNVATIGGNLCNGSPAADGVPPLLVLDAQVVLSSVSGSRRMALGAFILGNRRTDLRAGEMLTFIEIPKASAQGRAGFLKLGARKYLVISIAMVAVRLVMDGDRIVEIAIAVGACSEVARRLRDVEADLIGLDVAAALAALSDARIAAALAPIDDVRADRNYRNAAAPELVRRVVMELAHG